MPQPAGDNVYEGRERKANAVKWTGTRVDIIFGSHSQLRAFAEVYTSADAKEINSVPLWNDALASRYWPPLSSAPDAFSASGCGMAMTL
jgi:hypothetical protein